MELTLTCTQTFVPVASNSDLVLPNSAIIMFTMLISVSMLMVNPITVLYVLVSNFYFGSNK